MTGFPFDTIGFDLDGTLIDTAPDRMLWGSDHRFLLPASVLLGAAFVVLADALARAAAAPTELPVGVVTAFVGVPFFIWLLRRRQA